MSGNGENAVLQYPEEGLDRRMGLSDIAGRAGAMCREGDGKPVKSLTALGASPELYT